MPALFCWYVSEPCYCASYWVRLDLELRVFLLDLVRLDAGSVIGNVAKGTWFALAQSLAATRLLANFACLAAIIGSATIIALYFYLNKEDFDNLIHSANSTTRTVYSNITTMVSSINISSSQLTEPMNKLKVYFDDICKNCTNIFG